MRIRTLLAATTATALSATVAGVLAAPAHANQPISDAQSGHLVSWGGSGDADAITLPDSLNGKRVVDVSIPSANVTGAVTADGGLHVWGPTTSPVVAGAPTNITDASTVALNASNGVVLEKSGQVVGWGTTAGITDVPGDLDAKAVAIDGNGTGFAVTTGGTLATWGAPATAPSGLSNLTDVVAGSMGAVLDADGNVTVWPGGSLIPSLAVPDDLENCGCIDQVTTGGFLYGVIRKDGSIELWGFGAIPDTSDLDGKKVVSLAIDNGNVIAVTADGKVHAYGSDTDLTDLSGVSGINDGQQAVAVAAGNEHAAVIVTDFRAVTAPAVTGSAVVGKTLAASAASFSLDPDAQATGQWLANGQPISGATGTTLKLGAALVGKKISYEATATRGGDTVTSTSMTVGPVAKATSKLAVAKVKVKGKKKAKKRAAIVKATVRTNTGALATGTVKVTIKGKVKVKGKKRTVTKHKTVKLNGKGIATVKVKGLKHGKYTVTVRYPGSSSVTASHGKKKFKV